MDPVRARRILLVADTMSPFPAVRVAAILTLAIDDAAMCRPFWWRWSAYLSLAITLHRLGFG